MREKFWQYMRNPSAAAKAKLTSMEQKFAETLKDGDWPDGQKKDGPKKDKPAEPKPKAK